MTPPRRAREDDSPGLPGIAHADGASLGDEADADATLATPDAPEPDRWTAELPLPEPAPGLGADLVNDITQIYLNEISQHLLLGAEEELVLARAMVAGDFEARQRMIQHNLRLVVS